MKKIALLLFCIPIITHAENKVLDGPGPVDYKQSNFEVASVKLSPKDSVYPAHVGKSPKAFDKFRVPSDTFIVADQGPDNDVYRTRDDSKEYDLTYKLEINRYVGDVAKLKENKLISETFELIIPAFDVDPYDKQEDCDGDGVLDNLNSEVDEVYLNGEFIGYLSGNNEVWDIARNTFKLPIEKLKLPETIGEIAVNTVQINIDVGNKYTVLSSGVEGCQAWATEIDYVAIDFEVVDPVIMLAGLSGKEGAFVDSRFPENLDSYAIPNAVLSHTINAQTPFSDPGCKNTPVSFKVHANEFKEAIIVLAEKYGANTFNLITHSKGGLDSRYLINNLKINKVLVETSKLDSSVVQNPIQINSLVSLSTPFEGSIAATAMRHGQIPFGKALIGFETDYCDLDIFVSSLFSKLNPIPNEVNFLAISADIDTSNDGIIDSIENEGNQIPNLELSQKIHDLIKYTKGYEIVGFYSHTVCAPGGSCADVDMPILGEVPTNSPQYNDTSVSVNSAHPADADIIKESYGNHGTVLLREAPGKVYSGMQSFVVNEGVSGTGVLKWRSEK